MALPLVLLLAVLQAAPSEEIAPIRRLGTGAFKAGVVSNALVFLPDGRTLVSGGGDGVLRLWDARDGSEFRTLAGHAGAVTAVDAAAGGTRLVSASADGSVRSWDAAGGAGERVLAEHRGGASAVAVSTDGRVIFSGGRDGRVRLRLANEGEAAGREFGFPGGAVAGVALSPDGSRAAAGGDGDRVLVWSTGKGEKLLEWTLPAAGVRMVVFSPDGAELSAVFGDGKVLSRGLGDEQAARSPGFHEDIESIERIAYSPDGRLLAAGGAGGVIGFWDRRAGRAFPVRRAHEQGITALSFSGDSRVLASAGTDLTIRLWETLTGGDITSVESPLGPVLALSFSPDGSFIAAGAAEGSLCRWETSSGRRVAWRAAHTTAVTALGFVDEGRLWSAGWDRSLRLWDLAQGAETRRAQADGAVMAAVLAPDRTVLTFVTTTGAMTGWSLRSAEQSRFPAAPGDPTAVLEYSPDGRLLASGRSDGSLSLWDPVTGKEQVRCKVAGESILCSRFFPDGTAVLAGTDKGSLAAWEIPGGAERFRFRPHSAAIHAVQITPDSRTAISGGADGALIRTELSDRQLSVFRSRGSDVRALTMSKDGSIVASGHQDSTVLLWSLDGRKAGPTPPEAAGLDDLWAALESSESRRAFDALRRLAARPAELVPKVMQWLLSDTAEAELRTLLRDLGSDDIEVRDRAANALPRYALLPEFWKPVPDGASRELHDRLEFARREQDSPLAASKELLRTLRIVQALEWSGTAGAKEALERIASGAPQARLSREAAQALQRLRRKR